jgi:Patatin-like phospholipase
MTYAAWLGKSTTVEAAARLCRLSGLERRRIVLYGRRPQPVPSYTGLLKPAQPGKTGIACAGSGVRSAAFSLGALQALSEEGVVARSDYVSAVSGGAYIAAAFAMVKKTWAGRTRPEHAEPGFDDSDPATLTPGRGPFFPGSPEEQYLRNRSSYLAPGVAGKVRLGYRLLLGLAVNLGFIALFIAIVSILLAIAYGALYPTLAGHTGHPLHLPAWAYVVPIAIAAGGVLLGLVAVLFHRVGPRTRDFACTWSVRLLLLAIAAAALLDALPLLLGFVRTVRTPPASQPTHAVAPATAAPGALAVGAAGIVTAGSAIVLQLRTEWRRFATTAVDGETRGWLRRIGTVVRGATTFVLAVLVGPALVVLGSVIVMSATLNQNPPGERWLVCAALAAVFVCLYALADLTTWSLHPFYRERLCSAFALKRVALPEGVPPISGDAAAGIAVARDYDVPLMLSDTAIDDHWPELIVCAAANVSDDAATPPGRSVTSFTFSARHVGGPLVGQVATHELEGCCKDRQRAALTLPAAVAMSGAAISPAMGKKTHRRYRFLLALANVRLGVWVPNPRWAGRMQEQGRRFGRPRPSYLLRELLGINPINARFLYVTDGGHYDSTGIVELLRRGCTDIFCFDAGDGTVDALADAVSLARSELGVEISFAPGELARLAPDGDGVSASDFVTGSIAYPGHIGGTLRYACPALTATAPADALGHRRRDPRFPNDAVYDQLYTDARFEAYRALGLHAAEHMLEPAAAPAAAAPAAVTAAR